jgi:hypothetical protein
MVGDVETGARIGKPLVAPDSHAGIDPEGLTRFPANRLEVLTE